MKRALDIILVVLSSPLWLPVFALTALAVRWQLGRGVIFRQERAGLGCKPFTLVKFRTMLDGDGPDKERTPPFGAFLRSTSLDELPQLFLVLCGTMSLVGPRPLPVRYLERYTKEELRRHDVPPGITGWAQINGRNAITWDEKLALDVWYVDHRSLALDIKILFLTIAAVFTRHGIDSSSDTTMEELRPPKPQ